MTKLENGKFVDGVENDNRSSYLIRSILKKPEWDSKEHPENATFIENLPLAKLKEMITKTSIILLRKEIDFFQHRSRLFKEGVTARVTTIRQHENNDLSRYYLASRLLIEKENSFTTTLVKFLSILKANEWKDGQVQRCLSEFRQTEVIKEIEGAIRSYNKETWIEVMTLVDNNASRKRCSADMDLNSFAGYMNLLKEVLEENQEMITEEDSTLS